MKIRLKADWVIPAGTEFKCCDGLTRVFMNGNHEALVEVSADSTAYLYIDVDTVRDKPELFEAIP